MQSDDRVTVLGGSGMEDSQCGRVRLQNEVVLGNDLSWQVNRNVFSFIKESKDWVLFGRNHTVKVLMIMKLTSQRSNVCSISAIKRDTVFD